MQNSSEVDVVENVRDADADHSDVLPQRRKSEQTDKQPIPVIESEYPDRSTEKISYEEKTFSEENKVKQKFNSMDDLDDLTQSSETFSEHCELPYSNCENFLLLIEQLGTDCKDSVSLLKIQDAFLSCERLIELKKSHCEILTGKIKKMENRISKLQKELLETKEMKSQLEHQKVEWEQELRNLRFTLKEEKEKRRNMDMLYDKIKEQLRKKEEQYIKVVEMNQQLETTLRTLDMELKIVKNNLNQIAEERNDIQRQLSQERNTRTLQDGILTNHLCKPKEIQTAHDKINSEAMVRQLQQELADTLKKQYMSEASLEVTSRYHMDLEKETQDLKKKLDQIRSQLQEAQDRCAAAERCAEETQDHTQRLEMENANLKITIKEQSLKIEHLQTVLVGTNSSQDEMEQLKKYIELKHSLEYKLDQEMKKNRELEKEITGFKKLLKITKRKLNEYENGELSFPGDLKPNQIEVDMQINMLKHKNEDLTAKLEAASSKCQHLDEKNKCLQEELLSMKALQKKCEKLRNKKKKWKQEVINLKTHTEMNMVEFSELEQYKRKIEERARQDIEEKLEEVNLFLQTQAASQENLEQLRETHNASIRSQLELRIKDLESELAEIKISQNYKELNLEKYKQLYLGEIESRKSLANILNKTNERLAELSTELLLQKQQNRSLLSTLHPKAGLDVPYVGNLNSSSVLYGNFTPRENLVVAASRPQTSSKSMETYLIEMRQELEIALSRELKEDAAEFEAEAYRACPVASTDQANSYQDLLLKTSREYAQILRKNYMI